MQALIGVAAFVAIAAVTPGPNNLVVLRAAVQDGLRATLPLIGGIVCGGLVLLALVAAGAGAAFAAWPYLPTVVAIGGCAWLAWLGASLVIHSLRPQRTDAPPRTEPLPAGFTGLFFFQFLNPKGWVMVLAAVSIVTADTGTAGYAALAVTFVLIPTACLALWALLGRQARHWLQRPRARAWFDRTLGSLLIASALLPFIGT